MKDLIIGGLVLLLLLNTIVIWCCIKGSSEVEDDYKPSTNRDRKTKK